MKKFSILIAAVAMMAMTACNGKVEKNDSDAKAPATEQVDTAQKAATAKVTVEKAAPTEDGKDHIATEFANEDYQVRLENLADGTYRLSLWKAGQDKSGKPEQVVETKQCVKDKENYLMKGNDGKNYVIRAAAGKEGLIIMDKNGVIYPKMKGK